MEPRTLVEQIASLEASVQAALAVFLRVIGQGSELGDGQGLRRREAELEAAAKRFLAEVLAGEVQQALDSEAMGDRQRALIGAWPKKLKFRGVRQVRIRTLWGEALTVRCGYWGGKHRGGRGLYPGLQLLGIHDRCTPKTGSEMARLVVALGSLGEARAELDRRGVGVNGNTCHNASITRWHSSSDSGKGGGPFRSNLKSVIPPLSCLFNHLARP